MVQNCLQSNQHDQSGIELSVMSSLPAEPTIGEECPTLPVTQSERDLADKCLNSIAARAQKLRDKGLTVRNFVFGVANTIFVAWSFGAWPKHFCIVYLVEVFVLLPIRFKSMASARPKEHFYWLDLCWVANFMAVLFILFELANLDFLKRLHKPFFCAAWGIANGPLLCAAPVLNNALIFHDFDTTAGVLIHVMPSLVMFHLRWHPADPQLQNHNFQVDKILWKDIYVNAALSYIIWWIWYTLWLLAMGMNLPKYEYDTVFHASMRGSIGETIYAMRRKPMEAYKHNQKNNGFTRGDALAYMLGHAISVFLSILVSFACFWKDWAHLCLVVATFLSTIFYGAKRYTYYMTEVYEVEVKQSLGIPPERGSSGLFDEQSELGKP